jgi:hypothetical protein
LIININNINSPTRLHGVVLNLLSTGTTLLFYLMEEGDHGLINVIYWNLPGRTEENGENF